MKRLLFFIFTLLCANVIMAQTRFIVGELQYEVTGTNEIEVHDCMPSATSIVIPNTVTYQGTNYSVTKIGEDAFEDCSSLTSVTIPNSVTFIKSGAFANCSSLTSVTIPNSVTSIAESAFYNCRSITSIDIPNSIIYIGWYAFEGCSSLTSVTIPNSLTSINAALFRYCSSLTSVTIPNSVTYIGDAAFKYCSSLTSVTIPNSVTSIGSSAFAYCSSLTSVTLPQNATIENSAFYDAGTEITIDSITYSKTTASIMIGFNNFTNVGFTSFYLGDNVYRNPATDMKVYNCDTNKSGEVVIPSAIEINDIEYPVTSIRDYAFQNCRSLTSVTIGNSVTSIEVGAFYNCSSLTSVTCLAETAPSLGNHVFSSTPSTKTLTVPCESDYSSWESATTWASVNEDCPALEIGDRFTIGYLTYEVISANEVKVYDCDVSAIQIEIPSIVNDYNVTSIGDSAFRGCFDLTSVNIPNSVTSIGSHAFSSCFDLTSINIPNSVTSIGRSAFASSGLTSINIPNGVTTIDTATFYNCDNLTSINIPNSVTSICYDAFCFCNGLESVTIPNSVTSIGNDAFYCCNSLDSVTIPNSVISIGYRAFQSCSSLTSIDIPNSVTSIGFAAFCECSSLTSITIPNSVTSIGDYVFSGCSSLTSVTISNSVTSIGKSAFQNCSSLTSVTIPNSVTSIGEEAFHNCSSLTSVTCLANTPPSLGESVFYVTPSNKILNVNCGLKDDYILSWGNEFDSNNIFEIYPYNVEAIVNNEAFGSIEVENNCSTATLTANPTICSQFVSWNDGNTDNPRTINLVSDTSFTALFEEIEFNTELNAIICEGQTYTDNNFNVSEAGVYTQNLTSINGCDSIVTLTLNVNPIFNTELTATICEGQAYTENNFNVSEAGVYTQNLQTINGCDSIVTLTLNVNPIFNTELTATICQGQAYTENGFYVSEAGVYTQTLTAVNGCDSIVTLTLKVNPIYNTELTASICEGQVYNENGFNVNESGVYTQNLQTINGCDSIVTLTLNVNPIYNTELSATICEGQVYNENGFNVNESGVYTQNLQTINGCDSIVTLTLNVNPIYNTELTATICQGQVYTENNFNVSEAGVYTQTLTSVNGCDSIVTLTLNVNPIYNTELTATICQGQVYNENGFNVSEAGVYTQNLQTINGCDSIVTLTLNVNPIYNTELTATICEGQAYTENGFNVNEAGTYTQNLTTANGCDSIVTLTLNVNPIYNTELTATICEGSVYTENNFNVSEAGVYTQTLQTVNGCDSIVTLTLNVNPIYNTELTATICEGQVYADNGFNVSEAGVHTQNLQTANGCDSIVTLTLNVNPIYNTELTATICEGQVYNENGFNVNESGVYTQNLQTVNGCDSIVTLTLNVNPIYNTELTATICQGSIYTENGFNVSEAGVYSQTLQTINGCDSIVTLTLTVNPIFHTELSATICEGSVYNENGFNVSEAGTYTQNLTTANGCDSIVTLALTVLPSYNTNLTATICEGTSLNFSGFNVSEAGVYTQTYTAVNGCDSIVTLTVTELPIIHTDLTLTICEGTSLNFSGFNVSEAGVYTQNLTSVNGCDSIVTLTVSVNPVFDTTINATINTGETYAEFGFNESESGTYVQNLQTVNGCDSTITLNLTVNSSLYDVAELAEITFYPNPTSGKVTFSKEIEKIEVIDNIGKVVMRFFETEQINIETLPSGAYYLRLTIEDKTIMRKVIKE